MVQLVDDIIGQCLVWQDQGLNVVFVMVIEIWGFVLCFVGSQLVINENGDFVGLVLGGCIEGVVVEEVFEVMEIGQIKFFDFGVSNLKVWEVGFVCGGKIQIYVDFVCVS